MIVINHDHPESVRLRRMLGKDRFNGAYYYSREICDYFIPNISTDRNWMTIRAGEAKADRSIIFVHDILNFERKYAYTFDLDDPLYVVSMPWNIAECEPHGKVVFLPLSVDSEYVQRFRHEKDRDTAFVGRREWRRGIDFPDGIDYIENVPREKLLSEMAHYRRVYALSRTAIEARMLGCEILPYHPRFQDPDQWQIYDSRDAAKDLQRLLDEADA